MTYPCCKDKDEDITPAVMGVMRVRMSPCSVEGEHIPPAIMR
jgi:hypothetical protein